MITLNKIRCKECGDELESKHRHDLQICSCWDDKGKGCAADGGKDYLRRLGKNYEELSEYDSK